MSIEKYVTVRQAAQRLGVTAGRVRQLIVEGRIKSVQPGRERLIAICALESFAKIPRKPGPRKIRSKPINRIDRL